MVREGQDAIINGRVMYFDGTDWIPFVPSDTENISLNSPVWEILEKSGDPIFDRVLNLWYLEKERVHAGVKRLRT